MFRWQANALTVSLEANMLCLRQKRKVVVINIPSAFIHVDMEGTVRMVLEGAIVVIILNLKPILYKKMNGTTRE